MWLMWMMAALAEPSAHVRQSSPAPTRCAPSVHQLTLPDALTKDPRLLSKHLIVVDKGQRQLMRYSLGHLVQLDGKPACWWHGLSSDDTSWTTTKTRRGDMRTPEGFYRTSDKPWSNYYGAIAVHYPELRDAVAGQKAGLVGSKTVAQVKWAIEHDKKPPQNTRLGGEILIHGGGGRSDWTLGCIAMDNDDLDTLRASLPDAMKVDVLVLP